MSRFVVIVILTFGAVASAQPAKTFKTDVRIDASTKKGFAAASFPCRGKTCPPEVLVELGTDVKVRFGGMIDLMGPATEYRHQGGGLEDGLPGELPATAKHPAAIFQVTSEDKGIGRTELVIVSLADNTAKIVFRDGLAARFAHGGGFSTINSIKFEKPDKTKPLVIAYSQTSLPGKTEKPNRPGPPLGRRFELGAGGYARAK